MENPLKTHAVTSFVKFVDIVTTHKCKRCLKLFMISIGLQNVDLKIWNEDLATGAPENPTESNLNSGTCLDHLVVEYFFFTDYFLAIICVYILQKVDLSWAFFFGTFTSISRRDFWILGLANVSWRHQWSKHGGGKGKHIEIDMFTPGKKWRKF